MGQYQSPELGVVKQQLTRVPRTRTLFPATQAKEWIKNNPKAAAALGLTAGGLTVVAAPALLTGPVLSFMGFGSSGIVGGTYMFPVLAALYLISPLLERLFHCV